MGCSWRRVGERVKSLLLKRLFVCDAMCLLSVVTLLFQAGTLYNCLPFVFYK